MSELITINTDNVLKDGGSLKPVEIFALVGENSPILKVKCEEFDFENPPVKPVDFASTLVETCKIKGGYGLAANQCGYSYRVFVMGAEDEYVAFFNPVITTKSEKMSHMVEGCLSFPMLALGISRPERINVEYQDFTGKKQQLTLSGLSSHVFQHELDHLNGIVYTQRAKPMALKMGMKKRTKFNKLVDRYETANKKLTSLTN